VSLPGDGSESFPYVISCVSPDEAENVPWLLGRSVASDSILFEWNTVSPATKQRIGNALPASMVDVALIDSLDTNVDVPSIAVSGPKANAAASLFTQLGFSVAVVGDEVGDAASLKYLRSTFMKTLEALTLAYASLAITTDTQGVVRESIARSLGDQFVAFMDLLVRTNRLHADRRAMELARSMATFPDGGPGSQLGVAAVEVLRAAAAAWNETGAPSADADVLELAQHLRRELWRDHSD
jgi:hypothetical protein